jgi:outer membrane receptor protein involved in Fe transport
VGNGEIQVVAFHHKLTDAIRRITLPDRKRMRVNSDEVRSTGLEFLFSQTFGRVALDADLTLQKVELMEAEASASTEPENMPEQVGRVKLSVPVVAGITVMGGAEYTGVQYAQHPDTGEDVELDGGVWWNAGLSRTWSVNPASGLVRRVETTVSVDNLSDTLIYDQYGLPRMGRLFRFQLRVF